MNENFETEYRKGILSKKLFLESETIKHFIDWLVPFVKGDENLTHIGCKYKSFIEAINNYEWKNEKFSDTLQRFENYRNNFKTYNDEQLRDICIEILKWGGVLRRSNENMIKMRTERKSLKVFLLNRVKMLDKHEIIIDDLNPNHISSGYTKIYAAVNENFIMYDSRVGSALCFLIKTYLKTTKKNELPVELLFGYGLGQGKKNRNPNSDTVRFVDITQNRTIHFVSNIKANWLLKEIAKKVELPDFKSDSDKVFALQTALFVLGEEIPSVS